MSRLLLKATAMARYHFLTREPTAEQVRPIFERLNTVAPTVTPTPSERREYRQKKQMAPLLQQARVRALKRRAGSMQ